MNQVKVGWAIMLYALLCSVAVAGNPFAGAATSATDPFVGRFTDGRLTLENAPRGGGYSGTLVLGGTRYPLEAQRQGERLQGQFADGPASYGFTLEQSGDTLVLETGGTVYRLTKVVGSEDVQPPVSAASTGSAPAVAPSQGAGIGSGQEVLARGAYGVLTRDNAVAFIEALEFVLAQVGRPDALVGHPRDQLIAQVAQTFPRGSAEDQYAIANARQLWSDTQSRWNLMPQEEKLAFARDVLVLAWGEQAVSGSSGQGGAGGGSGTGATMYINPNYPGSDCWASAGCTDYDAGSGTYTYEEYNYNTGSYDYYQQ